MWCGSETVELVYYRCLQLVYIIQDVKQYLQMFTDKHQEDWSDHLPAAEFALNLRQHAGTSKSPFEIVYGCLPNFLISIGKCSNIPDLENHLNNLAKVCQDSEAALRLFKECIKEQYKRNKKTAHSFNIGDLVWLASKDIKIHQPSPKLGSWQLGPYKVFEQIGDLDYCLKLPPLMKIHPVFHVNCLSLYNVVERPHFSFSLSFPFSLPCLEPSTAPFCHVAAMRRPWLFFCSGL